MKILLTLLLFTTSPQLEPRQLLSELKKAEPLVLSDPHQAQLIWNKHKNNLRSMPIEMQDRWLTMAIRSADGIQSIDASREAFELAIPILDKMKERSLITPYHHFLGTWFQKSGYFNEAKQAYLCAISDAKTEYDKLRYFSDMTITERDLGKYQVSLKNFQQALLQAEAFDRPILTSVIENNIGITYLMMQQPQDALVYFQRASTTLNRLNMKSFEMVTSANTLLTFALANEVDDYQELYFNIKKNFSPELLESLQPLLTIISQYHKVKNLQTPLTSDEKKELTDIANNYGFKGSSKVLIPPLNEIDISTPHIQDKGVYRGELTAFFNYCSK